MGGRALKKLLVTLTTGILLIFAIMIVSQYNTDQSLATGKNNAYKQQSLNNANFEDIKQLVKEEKQTELSHETIVELTDKFMQTLVQEIDGDNKIIHYQTKEELIQAFEKITTKEVALPYVEYYYQEKQDGLYIVPTETPPWFQKENNYERTRLDGNIVEISQQNQTDLYGNYMINIQFKKINNQWKIVKISHVDS